MDNPWISIDYLRTSMDIHAYQWISMGINGYLSISTPAADGKVGRGACAEVRLADEVRAEARLAHFLRQ